MLHPDDVAVADRQSGVLTYRRMLVGARLFSKVFRKFPGEAVGVLLPASVGADVAFFGLLMAGKLPAMLNWTLGCNHLSQAADKLALQRIVTSPSWSIDWASNRRGPSLSIWKTFVAGLAKPPPGLNWLPPIFFPAAHYIACPVSCRISLPWCCSPPARKAFPRQCR